jgi:hypothetical protein
VALKEIKIFLSKRGTEHSSKARNFCPDVNMMSLLSPSQIKWWQGCGSPGLQESLTWPRPALDSSEAGPEPRVHCGKTPPPPQGGPGPGRSPSSQSVIKGQNPEEESFSSSADRTAPPQMSPDLHSPGWGVWSDPTSQKSWLRSRCCPEERELERRAPEVVIPAPHSGPPSGLFHPIRSRGWEWPRLLLEQ